MTYKVRFETQEELNQFIVDNWIDEAEVELKLNVNYVVTDDKDGDGFFIKEERNDL